ncbi:MAG: serine/threonine protein kinase, partial [Actinobacteria bacterium]|nr:serine/threonine protein kinase [Actinomycetota bacterium]
IRAERRDAAAAVEALDWVPRTSRGYPESRQLRAEVLLGQGSSDLAVLDQAMRSIESASMDPATQGRYTVRILEQGLAIVQAGGGTKKAKIGSYDADEAGLRTGLERGYRLLARDAQALPERIELVNRANAVRVWSLT